MQNHRFVDEVRSLYEQHRRDFYTYALVLTRNGQSAEDAIHRVFCKLLAGGRLPQDPFPYVLRALRNAAIDEATRVARDNGRLHLFDEADEQDPRQRLDAEHALSLLAADERECVVLKVFNGMTFREIAAVRGVSINTAASWYRRGIERMRASMEDSKDGQS